MIIDGKKINEEIKGQLRARVEERKRGGKGVPSLGIVVVGSDPVSARYVRMKKKFGEEIGVFVIVYELPEDATTEVAENTVRGAAAECSGVIVQLPMPKQVDSKSVLNLISAGKDVDLLSDDAYEAFEAGESDILPPVAGAVAEILARGGITDVTELSAVVVGRGKLVGRPVANWLTRGGAHVEMIGRDTKDLAALTREADIIVTGAGVPNLITPDMLPEKSATARGGVALIDAATSDVSGKLVGDTDPACAEKCAIYSGVPGGVGPITVAILFRNLVILAEK